MFRKATAKAREAIYGVLAFSQVAPNRVNGTNGTAVMVAAPYLVTAAHLCHVENNHQNPVHQRFEVIRAPDIGNPMQAASLVAENADRDIALLRVDSPTSDFKMKLLRKLVEIGTPCGSAGFPLASVRFVGRGRQFNLDFRFQSASISAYIEKAVASGARLAFYETDALMYKGSSGCPGFLANGRCFGIHVASVVEKPQQGGTGPLSAGQSRLAISLWVPSTDILRFLENNGIRP